MTQTITRMYATPQVAAAAADALRAAGFDQHQAILITHAGGHERGSNRPETTLDSLTAEIMAARVLKAHARIYAVGVSRGGSLVVTHAMFGRGALATHIMDTFDPVDAGVAEPADRPRPWDEATPLSSALRLGVLSDQPTPFSAFWNLPVLARHAAHLSTGLHLPLLANHATSLSQAIGVPTLIPHGGSWSEKVGIPVLWRRRSARP